MEERFASLCFLHVRLWTVLLNALYLSTGCAEKTITTQGTERLTPISGSILDSDHTFTLRPLHISLIDFTNCTNPYISLRMVTNYKGDTLLHFSVPGNADIQHISCLLHVTSKPSYTVYAVLLEHSLCTGGVFVTLWDDIWRRRWNVCSVWHVPGPDFSALSNEIDVIVELNEVSDHRSFTIHFMAVRKPHRAIPEVRYLSATEGKFLVLPASHSPQLPS